MAHLVVQVNYLIAIRILRVRYRHGARCYLIRDLHLAHHQLGLHQLEQRLRTKQYRLHLLHFTLKPSRPRQ
jgi:hypothetical protein